MNLDGTIPDELSSLQFLDTIDLANNTNLRGNITSIFSNMDRLNELLLSDTDISGTIPTEVGRLQKLKTCHLFGNKRLSPGFESFCSIDSLETLIVDCYNQTKACSCCTCHKQDSSY